MKHVLAILVLVGVLQCGAEEVVVLTETPLAKFTLPDGGVLSNAYVWKRSSQGLMIVHDGGSYFLNFKTLPDDWRLAYLGEPEDDQSGTGGSGANGEPVVEDRYGVMNLLGQLPELDDSVKRLSLGTNNTAEVDRKILMVGVLQGLLANNRQDAKRLLLFIEEQGYATDEIGADQLFQSCESCGGDGVVIKACKACGGSGKCFRCDGSGTRGESRMRCSTCQGSGLCPACLGEGELVLTCPKCRGAKTVVNKFYCEILRDRIVRELNVVFAPDRWGVVPSSASSHIDKVLPAIPGLEESVREFYLSEEYDGSMDSVLVAACLLQSLINRDYDEGKRFNVMQEVLFPETAVLDYDKYMVPCEVCKATGEVGEEDCKLCKGTGKCSRCEGTGERVKKGAIIVCDACEGSGVCTGCGGERPERDPCNECGGLGRILDKQRTEIKLGLLVDNLNEFCEQRKTSILPGD